MTPAKKRTSEGTLENSSPSTDVVAIGLVATTVIGAVPEGFVADFLTGKQVRDTPEEYVRQNIEKALVRQYRYSPSDCEPEFPIKVGSSRKRVDIVVFASGSEHKQENIVMCIECKRATVPPSHQKDGVGQLQSYMAACINAQYGLWTNGEPDRLCFAKRSNKSGFSFEEIIEIPGYGQTEEDAQRPKRRDLKPATADNLLFAFRRCHNYIAGSEGKQKPDAFWELLKLIFSKIEDERSSAIDFYVTPSERSNSTSAASAKSRVQRIFTDKVVSKFPAIFPVSDREIDLRPSTVAFVVSQLQNYSLLASPVDVKGVAYEEIVGSNLRGDRGEFFTPRNACRMSVSMLDPQPGERILDPACGTGGFLITAMNYVLQIIESKERSEWADPMDGSGEERQELYRKRFEFLQSSVFGIDLNPGLVRAAKMNMVMNNDGAGGLFQGNSLNNPHSWLKELSAAVQLGTMDVIVTNPPFGANITIDDSEVLSQYDLAAIWDWDDDSAVWRIRRDSHGIAMLQKSQPPEILFIERCLQLLHPGGRMAMVLPNGILNNPALDYVRQWILDNAQVLAVVDMHRDLFQPKNDTQTSILLLRKLEDEELRLALRRELDYPIFMAVAEKIGHDKRGNAIFRMNDDGSDLLVDREEQVVDIDSETGNDIFTVIIGRDRLIDDELPEVAEAYRDWVRDHR